MKTFQKTKPMMNILLIAVLFVGFFGFSSQTVSAQSANTCRDQMPAWSFGVISDTQWTVPDDGYNPNKIAANIVKSVDQQFINAGVDLVIAVGDTANTGDQANIYARALYAQDLYNAGIGFYPLRGNHEATESEVPGEYLQSGINMAYAFPQVFNGLNNVTPADITTAVINPQADLANNRPAAKFGHPFVVGTNFSAPTSVNTANNSLSYSFEYNNATFVLLDQFNVNGEYYPSTIPQQQDWIDQTLANRPSDTHAFVFVHKNLLGGNHKDNQFGGPVVSSDPGDGYGVDIATLLDSQKAELADKQATMNAFIASMQEYNVDVVVSGHDHHHYASVVTSPDGTSQVDQLITQSDSSKFYTPSLPASDNDAPVQQDLGRIGYYIFTVNGPMVTVDYYGDTTAVNYYGLNGGKFNFVKMSTLSYTLNGKENVVGPNGSYTTTDDTSLAEANASNCFKGTSMSILSGNNSSQGKTNYGKSLNKEVVTGWNVFTPNMASDTLSLHGMSEPGNPTDIFTLSMSYVPGMSENSNLIKNDRFGLLAKDASGKWVKAVSLNMGRTPNYVVGPWNASYGLGTYGVDPATHTAWAVINSNGDFAVGRSDK